MKSRILIIEDDEPIRASLADLLEEEGYEVISASTAKQAVELARKSDPDLIISDIMLPDGDGYGILEEVNRIRSLSAVPFIFLTAKTDFQDLRKGMMKGASDYLTKPYDALELIGAVRLRLEKAEKIRTHYKGPQLPEQIMLMHNSRPVFVKPGHIISITAENVYSNVFLKDSNTLLVRKSMKEWEKLLPGNMFIRIHRSTIINSLLIEKIEKLNGRSFRVFMKHTAQSFVISQRYASKLKSKLI